MRYKIHNISNLYAEEFLLFCKEFKIQGKSEDLYLLFNFSMNSLCKLDTFEYNEFIRKYGDICIKRLSRTYNTPSQLYRLSLEDRVNLVELCSCYLVAHLKGVVADGSHVSSKEENKAVI